jgi:ABC-type transport system involved in multi-copper enzyme maturation permease subunit
MTASLVAVVGRQVMREAWRRRTLPVLALFGCGIIIASAFLSFFQLGTDIKFFKDVAFTVIFLFGAMATLVLTSTQLSGEIESRTIYNVLSKPIRRYELVLGKFTGSIVAIAIAVAPMVAILMFFTLVDQGGSLLEAAKGGYMLWLSFVVLSAVALAIASFSSSIVCGALSVLVYVASYLKSAVIAYAGMVTYSRLAADAAQAFYYLLPNFENFNVRMAVVHNASVPWAYLGRTTLYGAALCAFFLYLGTQVFAEREF